MTNPSFKFRPLSAWNRPKTAPDKRRSRWTFKAGWEDTMGLLRHELNWLNARNVILEADFREQDLRLDGLPRANARAPQFPGVRVTFEAPGIGTIAHATDVCDFWQHNFRSIGKGMEALRAVDRHGITTGHEQYQGFRAIGGESPSGPFIGSTDEALAFLRDLAGSEDFTPKQAYRMAARAYHPDVAGPNENWALIDQSMQLLQKAGML